MSLPSLAQPAFNFTLLAQQGQARAGWFSMPHGTVPTPLFMPVGTQSALKYVTWPQAEALGARMVLGNAYHLYLRPGAERIARHGGLHGWMNWHRPILTDSGGFQVFSLAKLRKITERGVQFKDSISGDTHLIGPEEAMTIQNLLGADVMMAFDECPPYPVSEAAAEASLNLTLRWLERCWQAHQRPHDQALFPIVQGSTYQRLREQAVQAVTQYPAHGFAIGGVSVGEPRPLIHRMTAETAPLLPTHKPRYLMGVGTLVDVLQGIASGVDLFDCVLPTRNARHGAFFTPYGQRNIKKQDYADDPTPLVEGCACDTCTHHSKAYVRHLFRQDEAVGKTLLSIHNLYTLLQLTQQAREAILAGTFADFYHQTLEKLGEPVPEYPHVS